VAGTDPGSLAGLARPSSQVTGRVLGETLVLMLKFGETRADSGRETPGSAESNACGR